MQTRRKSSEVINDLYEPSKVKKVKTEVENGNAQVDNLKKFIKNKTTRKLLQDKGITYLFKIQELCYQSIYDGEDLTGQDRTGSGKTLAYCLPLIERMRTEGFFETIHKNQEPYVIALVPTRELALQVTTEIKTIQHSQKEFRVLTVVGGTELSKSIAEVRNGAEFVIGTPGRLLDLIQRGTLKLSKIKTIILDEADQMLQQGFQDDIEQVFKYLTEQRKSEEKMQVLLFSATVPKWVRDLSQKYMSSTRKFINLINQNEFFSQNQTSKTVKHYSLSCAWNMVVGVLGDIVAVYGGRHCRAIIFCETKKQANEIMLKAKLPVEAQPLHGDIPQQQRTVTFEGFKLGKVKCLVATNVASRGLDFPQVDLIVQLNPPKDIDTYIHRAGRTGRAGKQGVNLHHFILLQQACITLYTKNDASLIQRIERMAKIKFEKISAPQPAEIIKASSRDLSLSLKGISKEIVEMFLPVAEQIEIEIGATEALARALACVSGYKDKLQQRSMLGSFEGFVTYILRSPVQFRAFGYMWNFLKLNFTEQLCNQIKGMKRLKDGFGVAFDIEESAKDEMEQQFQQLVATNQVRGFELEIATSMPELEDDAPQGGYQRQSQSYGQSQGQSQQSQGYGERQPSRTVFNNQNKKDLEIFIGGLGSVDERDIEEFFEHKKVTFSQIRMLRDQDGTFKGVAFGVCNSKDMLSTAIALNGERLKGRPLRINMADQKPNKK